MNQTPSSSSNNRESTAPLLQLPKILVTSRNFGMGLEFSESPEGEPDPAIQNVRNVVRDEELLQLAPVRILHF